MKRNRLSSALLLFSRRSSWRQNFVDFLDFDFLTHITISDDVTNQCILHVRSGRSRWENGQIQLGCPVRFLPYVSRSIFSSRVRVLLQTTPRSTTFEKCLHLFIAEHRFRRDRRLFIDQRMVQLSFTRLNRFGYLDGLALLTGHERTKSNEMFRSDGGNGPVHWCSH